MNSTPDEQEIRVLLENMDLKLVLDSTENDYRFEYDTTSLKDRETGVKKLTRTYQLIDLLRNSVMVSPWDAYQVDHQATLITNMLKFGRYRMSRIVTGWEVICPACGHIMRGKIWETKPKKCRSNIPNKCRVPITDHVRELLMDAPTSSDAQGPDTPQGSLWQT